MGEAKKKRDGIIPSAHFTTPDGCVVVNLDGYLHFVVCPHGSDFKKRRTADSVKKLMAMEHGPMAFQDIGHMIACELINSINIVRTKCVADEAKAARMQAECQMFATALQSIERHPFVHISHNSEEQTTGITPMREIKTDAEFQKWHRDIVVDRYGAEAAASANMHPV